MKKIKVYAVLKDSWNQYFKDLLRHEYKELSKMEDSQQIDSLIAPFLKIQKSKNSIRKIKNKKYHTTDLSRYITKEDVPAFQECAEMETTQDFSESKKIKSITLSKIPSIFEEELSEPKMAIPCLKTLSRLEDLHTIIPVYEPWPAAFSPRVYY